jgi:hypothetical protein
VEASRKLRAPLDEEPLYSRVLASWRERLYG